MVVRIRLARQGTRNNPFYNIVAIRDKAARDARPIEKLGEWDVVPRAREARDGPLRSWEGVGTKEGAGSSRSHDEFDKPILTSGIDQHPQKEKRVEWNVARIQYWLSVGAQPSKPVAKLLDKAGLIPEGKWYKGIYRPVAEVEAAQALYLQTREGTNRNKYSRAVQRAQEVNKAPERVPKAAPEKDSPSKIANEAETPAGSAADATPGAGQW